MANNLRTRKDRLSVNAPSEQYYPVVVGEDIPDGPARYLLVGTAGTATLVRADGVEVANVPLVAGYNPLVVKQVKALGTAANIFYCN